MHLAVEQEASWEQGILAMLSVPLPSRVTGQLTMGNSQGSLVRTLCDLELQMDINNFISPMDF